MGRGKTKEYGKGTDRDKERKDCIGNGRADK